MTPSPPAGIPLVLDPPVAGVGKNRAYTLYLGCTISTEQFAYEVSAREILKVLGIDLVHLDGYSCCGITIRSQNQFGFLYMSARNLAIAEQHDYDVLTYCTGCRLSLQECLHMLGSNADLNRRINEKLAIEDLHYEGKLKVTHILELLHDIVGPEEIKRHVKRTFPGMRVAPHYGCHALRPRGIGQQDDVEKPMKLDFLIEAIGAQVPYHANKTDCCGAPMLLADDNAAFSLAGSKLQSLQGLEFDLLVNICPSCQKMFDNQKIAGQTVGAQLDLPVMYFTQLLGLAFGIEPNKLALNINMSNVEPVLKWKGPESSRHHHHEHQHQQPASPAPAGKT